MQITKLDRSGYMLEFPDYILVFNYTRDEGHHVEKTLRSNPDKAVVFLVSHNHRYTFDTDIFNMAQNQRRIYVLSNDIPTREIHDDMPIDWMSAGDRIENVDNKDIRIEALRIGEAGDGVGYYVTAGDTTILYGGQLGKVTDRQHTEVLIERIATEHPSVSLAIVGEDVADLVAAKIATAKMLTYRD